VGLLPSREIPVSNPQFVTGFPAIAPQMLSISPPTEGAIAFPCAHPTSPNAAATAIRPPANLGISADEIALIHEASAPVISGV